MDGAAQLWDSDGRRIARLPGSDFAVTDAAFSPDGARAVTASEDGSARIWDAATGRRIAVLRHGRTVNGVRFSADGRSVVTAGDDGTARVWPATGGAAIRVLRGHTDSVVAAAFTAGDTRIVTAADDGSARVWSARAPGVTPLAGSGAVESLAASPDGSRILGMDENGFATIWSTADGRRRASLDGNPSGSYACLRGVGCAPWSADGRFVAGVNWPGVATLWDAGSGREVRRLGGRAATSAAFAPDGRTVAVIWRRNAARLIRAGDGTPAGEPLDSALGLGLQSVQFAAGGRWLQTIDDVDSAALLALAGGRVVDLGLGVLPTAIAVSPDGARVAVGTQLGVVRVLALPSGRPLGQVAAHGAVESVAFDRAGRRLVTAGADRTARVWSARTLTPLAVLREHLDEVKTAAFSPDGRFVLTTSADATAKLWDPALEGSILTLPMRRDGGTAEFTRDGRTIVLTGRTGGEVHRCDVCADFAGLVELADGAARPLAAAAEDRRDAGDPAGGHEARSGPGPVAPAQEPRPPQRDRAQPHRLREGEAAARADRAAAERPAAPAQRAARDPPALRAGAHDGQALADLARRLVRALRPPPPSRSCPPAARRSGRCLRRSRSTPPAPDHRRAGCG